MLLNDSTVIFHTRNLGKSIRALGITGLIIFLIYYVYIILITFWIELAIGLGDWTRVQGINFFNRANYRSQLFFFAISAIFFGRFIKSLFWFNSLQIPLVKPFKQCAITMLIMLICICIIDILYVVIIEFVFAAGIINNNIYIIELNCFPPLLYLIGFLLLNKAKSLFTQFLPNPSLTSHISFKIIIIGASLTLLAEILSILGYFNEYINSFTGSIGLVGGLTLHIGVILVGQQIIKMFPASPQLHAYPAASPQPSSLFSSPLPPQGAPQSPSPTTPVVPLTASIPIQNIKFCPRCGQMAPIESTYCIHCGSVLPK